MTPDQELRYLILAAQRTGGRLIAGVLKPLGLTAAQAEVLQVLVEFGPLSLNALGRLLVCESGSPSRLVAGLVDRGLVTRASDQADGRAVELSISPEGLALVSQTRAIEPIMEARVGGVLSPQEIEAANLILRKMVAGSPAGDAVARRKRPG